jgi:hypothetical protein
MVMAVLLVMVIAMTGWWDGVVRDGSRHGNRVPS